MDYCSSGSPMYSRLRDGTNANWTWDQDSGIKTELCPGPGVKAPHMRLYADGNDRFDFNPTLGFFVIGTTHFDHNECAGIPFTSWRVGYWSGHSEDAEKRITSDLRSHYESDGWVFAPDAVNLYNAEHGRMQGSHRKQNNGLATEVKMPTS
jgi:hypothetical protein